MDFRPCEVTGSYRQSSELWTRSPGQQGAPRVSAGNRTSFWRTSPLIVRGLTLASQEAAYGCQTIEAINEGRLDDFLALFARDATAVDGPKYHGSEAIRAWAQRETFGVQMHVNVVQEKNAEGTVVEVDATSTGGYSGPGTLFFSIRKGLIERLEIR